MNRLVRSQHWIPFVSLAMTCVLSTTAPAAAQQRASSPFTAREASRTLSPGAHIRLAAPGVVIDEGVMEQLSGDTLVVSSEGQQWFIDASRLESLEVRERRTRSYAIRGAIGGAFLGPLFEVFLSKVRDCGRFDCEGQYGRAALIGAASAGALGALIGSTTTRWRQLFPEMD